MAGVGACRSYPEVERDGAGSPCDRAWGPDPDTYEEERALRSDASWVPEEGFPNADAAMAACLSSQISPREGQIGPKFRVKSVEIYRHDVKVKRELEWQPVGSEAEVEKLVMLGGFSGDLNRFTRHPDDSSKGLADRPRGDRKAATRLSYRSLLNMVHKLRNCCVMFRSLLTLTYPADFPNNGRLVKRHLDNFLKAFRRRYGRRPYAWFLEFQDRGAPHFHMLTDIEGFEIDREWLARTWARIVDGGEKCYRVHSHVKQWSVIRKEDGAVRYVAKYAKKQKQKIVPDGFESVGAFWGTSHDVKAEPVAEVEMTAREILEVMGVDGARFVGSWGRDRKDLRRYLWDQASKFQNYER